MLRLLHRSFARQYNQLKQRPRRFDKLHYKSEFAANPSIRSKIAEAISFAKQRIPMSPISSTLGKTGKEIKATETIYSFRIPSDPAFEKKMRKVVVTKGVTETAEAHKKFFEENLFMLDRSLESRRNVLLAAELEKFQASLTSNTEVQRRKALQDRDIRNLLGEKVTQFANVDQLLSRLSSPFLLSDQSHSADSSLVPVETEDRLTAVAADPLVETTGQTISYKGVIDLTGRTKGRLTFGHLTHRELANYICYNLKKSEEALQLFVGSRESSQFDVNLKASLLQKLAILPPAQSILSDSRLKDLLGDISRSISQLTTKNVSDSFWAICKLSSTDRNLTVMTEHLIQKLGDEVCGRMQEMNAMNLAFVCEGMWRMKMHLPTIAEMAMEKVLKWAELTEKMANGETEKPIEPWSLSITTQPSLFCGFEDRTLPKFPLTAPAMEMITRYVVSYPYFDREESRLAFLGRAASVIERYLGNEMNTETMVSLLRTFSQNHQLATLPQTQSLFRSICKQLFPSVFSLSFPSVTTVTESILNAGLYSLADLYTELELTAKTVLHSTTGEELVRAVKVWGRVYYTFTYGVDPVVDPAYVLLPKKPVQGQVINEFLQLIASFKLSDVEQMEIVKVFAGLGHRLDFNPALKGVQRLAGSPNYRSALFLLQASYNDFGFMNEIVSELPRIMNRETVETQTKVLLSLAHVGAKVDIDGTCVAVSSQISKYSGNRDVIPTLWALTALGTPRRDTVKLLVEKADFSRLTRLETVLAYQLSLEYPDLLASSVSNTDCETAAAMVSELGLCDDKAELPATRNGERNKRLSSYFVQFYSAERRTFFEKYKSQCRLSDGNLIGLLRMREEQLKREGVSREEIAW